MFVKKGVDATNVSPKIWFALGVAEVEARAIGSPLIVTALVDGQHKADSLHYSGNAADLRTRQLSNTERRAFFERLRGVLDPMGFDVLLESDHIHIEFDPKAGDAAWLQEVA